MLLYVMVLTLFFYINLTVTGNNDLSSGKWFSGNESVISMNELYGEAHAVGEGSTYGNSAKISISLNYNQGLWN